MQFLDGGLSSRVKCGWQTVIPGAKNLQSDIPVPPPKLTTVRMDLPAGDDRYFRFGRAVAGAQSVDSRGGGLDLVRDAVRSVVRDRGSC